MTAVAAELPVQRESVASRIARVLLKAPMNLLLGAVGLLWLVPTIGLFITSILPASISEQTGWWKIFTKPSTATWSNYDALFQFLWTWNDLIVALTFGQNTTPITVWIFGQLREFGTSIDVIAPASFISLIVPLAVFFAFQRYFVQGLLAGSVK